jgi:hypothetical protein
MNGDSGSRCECRNRRFQVLPGRNCSGGGPPDGASWNATISANHGFDTPVIANDADSAPLVLFFHATNKSAVADVLMFGALLAVYPAELLIVRLLPGSPAAAARYSLTAVVEYAPGTTGPVLEALATPGVPSRIAVVFPGRSPETSWTMIAQPKFVVSVAVIVGFVPTSPAGVSRA